MHEADSHDACRRLLHRWFVQYNPLYLLSATLVLAGVTMMQFRWKADVSFWDIASPALIAETYSYALLGAAAFLARLGQRRPAVLMVLIAIVYQADPTMVTEMGATSGLGLVWLASFVAKLFGIGWALRLRFSRRALAAAFLAAVALAALPWIASLEGRPAESLCALLVFALGVVRPERLEDAVTSAEPLDAFATKVLGRSLRFAYGLFALVLLARMQLALSQRGDSAWLAFVALAWCLVLRSPREALVWVTALGSIVISAAIVSFSELQLVVGLASLALLLRTRVAVRREVVVPRDRREVPYRADPNQAPHVDVQVTLGPVFAAERARLFTGALLGAHLATSPAMHAPYGFLFLAALATLSLATARHLRSRVPLTPLLPLSLHVVSATHVLSSVTTSRDWGLLLSGAGLSVLALSVAITYRLRERDIGPSADPRGTA